MGGRANNFNRPQVGPFFLMARKYTRALYKQVATGTTNMGDAGAQIHIAKVTKLDPALRAGYLKNVIVSVQNQVIRSLTTGAAVEPAYTVYLSSAQDGAWDDDDVISARAVNNGGNVSLTARRRIAEQSTADNTTTGPVHIWIEQTQVGQSGIDCEARISIEAWGRGVLLQKDF